MLKVCLTISDTITHQDLSVGVAVYELGFDLGSNRALSEAFRNISHASERFEQ